MKEPTIMLDVIFEDNHLLVLNKPPLLATMGAEPGQPSLLEQARDYIRDKYNKPGNVYLGVVSRLDSHVSGAIMFARTSKSASRISDQIRTHRVEKIYRALVPAGVLSKTGTLEDWVYKDDASRRMRCVTGEKNSHPQKNQNQNDTTPKLARLTYRKIATDHQRDVDLLEVQLETGRKHQIRVQLANQGCPILGDTKYGSPLPFPKGIALHCLRLGLVHPTLKTALQFEVEPPKNWQLGKFGV